MAKDSATSGRREKLQARFSSGSPEDTAARWKTLGRAYRVLTDTPVDKRGHVKETPFSYAGVAKLNEVLEEKANSGVGSKAANGMKSFLAARKGEEAVEGLSLAKLKMAAKFADNRNQRRSQKAT